MATITRVHPGNGDIEDWIEITVQYNPTADGRVPNIAHVIFSDGASAETFNVRHIDSTTREITLSARVPIGAHTGPIEVDVDGEPPTSTVQPFTVQRQQGNPLRILRISAIGGAYTAGRQIQIYLAPDTIDTNVAPVVSFPINVNGPACIPVNPRPHLTGPPPVVRLAIPAGAKTGRIKVQIGHDVVLSRPIVIQ